MLERRSAWPMVLVLMGLLAWVACDDSKPVRPAPPPKPVAEQSEDLTLTAIVKEKIETILREPDPYIRARQLGTLLPTLDGSTVQAAADTVANRRLGLRSSDYELLLRYWATYEPEQASVWAKEKCPQAFRTAALLSAVGTWAEVDPESASTIAWPWTVEHLSLEAVVPIALMRGWFARNEPEALRDFMSQLPPGILRQRAIAAYVRVVLEQGGMEPIVEWVDSLPDDETGYKLAVHRRVSDLVSQLDIEEGLWWCEQHCDGPYGKNMRSIIGRNWILTDPVAAMEWLATSEPGYDQDLAMQLAFGKWARRDHAGAEAWMREKTEGEQKPWLPALYPIYARMLAAGTPREALEWASRIENDQERENVTVGVARVWRHFDLPAAEEWLETSPLSEAARARARENVRTQQKLLYAPPETDED